MCLKAWILGLLFLRETKEQLWFIISLGASRWGSWNLRKSGYSQECNFPQSFKDLDTEYCVQPVAVRTRQGFGDSWCRRSADGWPCLSPCSVLSPGGVAERGWLQGGSWPDPLLSCMPWQAASLSFIFLICKMDVGTVSWLLSWDGASPSPVQASGAGRTLMNSFLPSHIGVPRVNKVLSYLLPLFLSWK